MNIKQAVSLLLIAAPLFLSACSSSSSPSPTPPPPPPPPPAQNVAPSVSINSSASVDEKASVDLTANADDTDGSIASYLWTQTGGTTLTLSATDTASISFTAPVAKSEETVSFEVTVTDDDGATATDTVDVVINPVNELTFTIKGTVSNGSAIPASITAEYASNMLQINAAAGAYELNISEDEDLASELLFLTATGTQNAGIKLTNIPASLDELMSLAGDDAELTIADDIAADITPISTAYYSLLSQELDLSTATDAEKEQALALLSSSSLLNTAASINLLSQSPLSAGISLPTGFADTLALANDRTALALFIRQALITSPDLMQTATATSVSQARPAVLTATYPLNLYGISDDIGLRGNYQFTLNADGTGEQIGLSPARKNSVIAWTEDAQGVYTLTGENGSNIIEDEANTSFVDVNGTFQEIAVAQVVHETTLTPVFQQGSNLTFEVAITASETYPETPELAPIDRSNTFYKNFFDESNFLPITIADLFPNDSLEAKHLIGFEAETLIGRVIGTRQDMSDITETNRGDFVTLQRNNSTDTSGHVTFQKLVGETELGAWSLENDILNVNFYSTYTGASIPVNIEYSKIAANRVISTTESAGTKFTGLDVLTPEDTTKKPVNSADFVGVYYYPLQLDGNIFAFWFQFYDNGEWEQVSLNDNDNDGIYEADEASVSIGSWDVVDGKVSFNRYWDFTTGDRECFRDSSNTNCNLFSERFFDVAHIESDDIYVKSDYKIFFPSDFSNPMTTNELNLEFNDARALKIATNPPLDINSLPPQNN